MEMEVDVEMEMENGKGKGEEEEKGKGEEESKGQEGRWMKESGSIQFISKNCTFPLISQISIIKLSSVLPFILLPSVLLTFFY